MTGQDLVGKSMVKSSPKPYALTKVKKMKVRFDTNGFSLTMELRFIRETEIIS